MVPSEYIRSSIERGVWQGCLLVLVVWLVCTLARKLPPATKGLLWWLVCLNFAVALLPLPSVEIPVLPAVERSTAVESFDSLAPRIGNSANNPSAANAIRPGQKDAVGSPTTNQTWLWLGLAWIVGVVVLAARSVVEAVTLARLVRRAQPSPSSLAGKLARVIGAEMGVTKRPRVLESDEISTPMAVGPIRPTILVPAGFSDTLSEPELRMAVAHELAHIRRNDLWMGWIPSLAQTVFFFLPPVWFACRKWVSERESACDYEALAASQSSPGDYARLLLKIVSSDQKATFGPAVGATASFHTLKSRLDNMKTYSTLKANRFRPAALGATVLCLALFVPWQVTAQDSTKNILQNSGFEKGLSSWEVGSLPPDASPNVALDLDLTTAHSGTSSVRFTRTESRYFPVKLLAQSFSAQLAGSRVRVSCWVKAKDVHKATVAVMFHGGEENVEWGAYVGIANDSDKAADHDWKKYGAVLAVPSGTTSMAVALEMYGPGTVWFDDVSIEAVSDATPLQAAVAMTGGDEDPLADLKGQPNVDESADSSPMKRYFLIGNTNETVKSGRNLLVVLPGGDGSADFNPFVRRIQKNALGDNWVVAQLVAPQWSDDQKDQLVWPTRKVKWHGMKFATEDFIESVIADVNAKTKINPDHVYVLAWSSGGPAAYAALVGSDKVKGAFVAMSIFRPEELPALSGAKGKPVYVFHSPTDFIQMSMPRDAVDKLGKAGAKVKLDTYEGGHGWQGDVFGSIKKGVDWLVDPGS